MMQMPQDAGVETKETFPATVAEVIDDFTVVINRGRKHGVNKGQNFLIYKLSETQIQDPITLENLGFLEMVVGTGDVINVQESISTIKSDMEETIEKEIVRTRWDLMSPERIRLNTRPTPFDNPRVGDKAKPI
jgi:hypothetical protein